MRSAICVVLAACDGNAAVTADAAIPHDAAPDATAALAATPLVVDFGATAIGCPSTPVWITVTNPGGSPGGPLATSIAGANASAFALVSDGCAGIRLGPGAACSIALRLTPIATGVETAALVISAAPASTSVMLAGAGLSAGALGISPSLLDFGVVAPGATSPTQTATITNSCASAQPTGAVQVTLAGSDPSQFAIVGDQCSGISLAGGASCTVGVAYAPNTTGTKTAIVDIVATPGGAVPLSLRGE